VLALIQIVFLPQWLEAGVRHLYLCQSGLVGGKIEMFLTDHPTAVEVYDSINYLNQKKIC